MRAGLARLLLGQVLGQLCLVVAVPVLTRLMDPTEVGLFQLASAIAVVAQPAATWCHEFRIPVAASPAEVAALRRVGFAMLTATTALCGAVALGGALAASWDTAETALTTALLLGAYAGTVLDNAVLIRAQRRSALAARNLLSGVLGAGLQIAAALLLGSAVALGVAVLVGRLAAIGLTRASTTPGERTGSVSLRGSLPAVGAQSIWVLSMQTMTLLATPFFGVVAAGYVGLAQRIAGAPTSLIGQALGQVAQSLLAPHVRARDGQLRRAVLRQTAALGALASAVAVPLMVLAPRWAATLLGEQYATVGTVTAILAVPFALQITAGPLTPLLIMVDRQTVFFRLQTLRALAAVLAVVGAGLLTRDFVTTCLVYAIAETASYAACLVVVQREAGRSDATARAVHATA
ncbi:oligosaccharide flippase family protein [Actinomycetospora endophytica]|uniref:Oligosaccharide flippase family protein n=1 Tax=Actinomycetospora endophytica TaxID=2291215 RepID=A0ABS8P5W3_9PSEU|nr:oligosaccharide flippase family protein [Actinomycetospora endophytica]MCD2193643.1 oligosaccharide flippase family protein [Actinomycetospora endophytica]